MKTRASKSRLRLLDEPRDTRIAVMAAALVALVESSTDDTEAASIAEAPQDKAQASPCAG
jgi:hypothetical protein